VSLTHNQLVEIGAKWLTSRCSVVVTELATFSPEQPDVLGWMDRASILIECKASRADFKADSKKPFRQFPDMGVGVERYYLTPAKLIAPDEIPNGWGLLESNGSRVRTIKKPTRVEANTRAEVGLLLSVIRRIGQSSPRGVSIKCYTISTGNRSALFLDSGEDLDFQI
jgi:hypothetical protein